MYNNGRPSDPFLSSRFLTKLFFLFYFCTYFSSCSFYRVTIGSGSTVGSFKSRALDDSNTEVEKEICVISNGTWSDQYGCE